MPCLFYIFCMAKMMQNLHSEQFLTMILTHVVARTSQQVNISVLFYRDLTESSNFQLKTVLSDHRLFRLACSTGVDNCVLIVTLETECRRRQYRQHSCP